MHYLALCNVKYDNDALSKIHVHGLFIIYVLPFIVRGKSMAVLVTGWNIVISWVG